MNPDQLRAELEKKSRDELIDGYIKLHQSNLQLKEERDSFEKQIIELESKQKVSDEKIETLENILNAYDNAHTPPSKQRFPKRKKSDRTKKIGRPKGYPGSTRKLRKPDRTIKLTADKCPHCKKDLRSKEKPKKIVKVVRIVVEDIPEPNQTTVTEFLKEIVKCPFCGKIIIPKHKYLPDSGNFGNNLLAHVALMKFKERLPYRKISESLERENQLVITHSTSLRLVRRVGIKLRKNYDNIAQRIKNSKVVHIDESKFKVDGKTYWIWIFLTTIDVLVLIRKSRGKNVVDEVLGEGWDGTIVCDGWKVYSSFTDRLQRCWAHLLREAKYLSEKNDQATPLYEELCILYKSILEKLSADPPPKERELLRKQSEKTLMDIICKYQGLGGEIRKLTNKINNGFKWWFTFVTNPLVSPTNNAAERGLREHIVHRKIIGTLRNDWGIMVHEAIMSSFQTWELRGYNLHQRLLEELRS